MTISQIYLRYKIMPSLQQHQLRVAAVAKTVAESADQTLDIKSIITACLLHDMGNILKFDLGVFPDFLQPDGLEYWQSVKAEFRQKYGNDEHEANLAIAKEIGVSQKVLDLISAIGFLNIESHFKNKDLEKMICEYADCRVMPSGIVNLEERLADLERRYGFKYPSQEQKQLRQKFFTLERQSEGYIFSKAKIKPADISETALNDTILGLKTFEIS